MTARRVAVVGGGLAGLAAAAQLRRLGLDAVVFERDAEVGGVARTIRHDGWLIDTGPAMAAEPATTVRELLDQAGLAEDTVRSGPAGSTRYIVFEGAPVLVPRTTSELSSSSLLSIAGRLRLLKERLIPPRGDIADESVDAFARRRFGAEMAERMFDPLIASTCAGDPRQIIARYAFPGIVDQGRSAGSSLQRSARARMEARRRARGRPTGSWSCRDGMQGLPRRLAKWIGDIRTAAAIDRIAATPEGISVSGGGEVGGVFDAVIVAVPAPAFGKLAVEVDGGARLSAVASMPHASIVAVSLGYRRDQVAHPLDCSRLLVPSIERRAILSMVFPSSLFPDRSPADHLLITAFLGGVSQAGLIDRTDDELCAIACREGAELLGITGEPVIRRVTRWRDALPQAVAGHGDRIAAADYVESAEPRVAFTGSWRDGLAVGEVLLGGVNAAARIAERIG